MNLQCFILKFLLLGYISDRRRVLNFLYKNEQVGRALLVVKKGLHLIFEEVMYELSSFIKFFSICNDFFDKIIFKDFLCICHC